VCLPSAYRLSIFCSVWLLIQIAAVLQATKVFSTNFTSFFPPPSALVVIQVACFVLFRLGFVGRSFPAFVCGSGFFLNRACPGFKGRAGPIFESLFVAFFSFEPTLLPSGAGLAASAFAFF